MKASIQTKLLVMCILLVLLTIVGISATYYVLATRYMRRESRQRIRIAFDIILDDFANRLNTYASRVREFLTANEPLQVTTSSYQQDPGRISSISQRRLRRSSGSPMLTQHNDWHCTEWINGY